VVGNKFKGVSGNAFAFLETLLHFTQIINPTPKKVKPEM